ncbi:MAG: general secretion pathway protein GspK [Clostridia bacterium]|nr:general secretion pathway protein GspK [Deltaproteobacteria bacterium]
MRGLTRKSERGIAIIVVLTTVALLTAVIAEFQYTATVDLQLAYNARDELQAEYNAMSALRLRSLVLRQGRALEAGMSSMLQALTGDSNTRLPLGQVLQQLPITCSLLSKILKKTDEGDDLTIDKKDTSDFFPGECSATSTSEHAKLSLNLLANTQNGTSTQVQTMLLSFLSDPRLETYFQHDDKAGSHADNPAQLVGAIADWVDRDRNENATSGDEDRRYSYLKDSYAAKNAPFDSIAELQLVHGVSDALYEVLKKHVTIYTDATAIELATASPEQILFGLLASRRAAVPPEQLVVGIGQLMRSIADMRASSPVPGMASLTVSSLAALVQSAGLDALIDVNLLRQVFTDRAGNTWYTLTATGKVGNASRTIHAVLQATEGQYYYFRME